MVFYTGLARLARNAGLVVREVNGWKSRTLGTRPNGMAGARGCLWHHTATSASAVKSRNNPTLNYMVNGLGYPLSNYGLAWDGSIDVIAAGAAAHAGKGRYGSRIPQDWGNDYLLGVEVEGTTGLTWSDAQLESAARLGHAMNKEWGSSFLQIGHLEYAPTRKVDPSGIPGGMPALRKAIARGYWKNKNWKPGGKGSNKVSTTTPTSTPTTQRKSWFEMASINDLRRVVREETLRNGVAYKGNGNRDLWSYVRSTHSAVGRIEAELHGENAGLSKAIESLSAGKDVSLAEIQEAAKQGVQNALDSIEADVTLNINTEDNE